MPKSLLREMNDVARMSEAADAMSAACDGDEASFQVVVIPAWTQKPFPVQIEATSTLAELKEAAADKSGLEASKSKLGFFNAGLLNGEQQTMSTLGVKKGSRLWLSQLSNLGGASH